MPGILGACTWNIDPIPYRERLPTNVVADLLIGEYETRYGDLPARCPEHLRNVVYVKRGEGNLEYNITDKDPEPLESVDE